MTQRQNNLPREKRSPAPRWGLVALSMALGLLVLTACSGDGGGPLPAFSPPTDDTVLEPGEEITFRLDPFTGAPGNLTDDLTRMIVSVAEKQKLKLLRRPTDRAVYRIRGNLAAVGDDSGTTVIYIYSIYNRNERLVHKIHGQEVSKGSRGDPWAGVQPDALRNIAVRTVDAVKAWVARREAP